MNIYILKNTWIKQLLIVCFSTLLPLLSQANSVNDYMDQTQTNYSVSNDWSSESLSSSLSDYSIDQSISNQLSTDSDIAKRAEPRGMWDSLAERRQPIVNRSGPNLSDQEVFACSVRICLSSLAPPSGCNPYLTYYYAQDSASRIKLLNECPNAVAYQDGDRAPRQHAASAKELTLQQTNNQAFIDGFMLLPNIAWDIGVGTVHHVKDSVINSWAVSQTMKEAGNNNLWSDLVSGGILLGELTYFINIPEYFAQEELIVNPNTGLAEFQNSDLGVGHLVDTGFTTVDIITLGNSKLITAPLKKLVGPILDYVKYIPEKLFKKTNDLPSRNTTNVIEGGAGGDWPVFNEFYDPNVIKQVNLSSCGQACTSMLLNDRNINVSQEFVSELAGDGLTGHKLLEAVLNELDNSSVRKWIGSGVNVDDIYTIYGLNSTGSWGAMLKASDATIGHWVVVDGVDELGNMIIRDSASGTVYNMHIADFQSTWTGYSLWAQ